MIPDFVERRAPWIIFFLGVLFLLPGIWSESSITGQDEYWLSLRTPMETLERGTWFTPWVNDEPRLRKPPLLYWAILLSYKLLGISLFSARIWGVLAGAGLATCSTLLYRELFRKGGLLAGLITLGTVTVAIEGRRAMLDLPMAFFTAMAVLFALKWGRTERPVWILLSAFTLGLSFLVKGPVGLGLFAVAALSALFVFKKWHFLTSHWGHFLLAILLLASVCLPWPVIMAYLWPGFLQVMDHEVAARGIGTFHLGKAFSTLGASFGLVFPWSLVLLGSLIYTAAHARQKGERENLWLVAWFFSCVIPFMFIRSFARYMTPLIPAASVLCASWLIRYHGPLKKRLIRISIVLLALASLLFVLFFLWFQKGILMAIICLLFCGIMVWMAFSSSDARPIALTAAILLSLLIGVLYPTLGINAMPPDLDEIVGSLPVAAFNSSQPSMLSIRLKRSAIQIRSFVEADRRKLKQFNGYVFMPQEYGKDFETLARKLNISFKKTGCFESFYSRQAWIRFAREDAGAADWMDALKKRSLDDLRPAICYYRVQPKSGGHE